MTTAPERKSLRVKFVEILPREHDRTSTKVVPARGAGRKAVAGTQRGSKGRWQRAARVGHQQTSRTLTTGRPARPVKKGARRPCARRNSATGDQLRPYLAQNCYVRGRKRGFVELVGVRPAKRGHVERTRLG